ncbi:MAG TPA: hypothetical protein VFV54_11200, partial [Thermoanaerobaculia bacterium]|nr:hypothetical protein [Thermoanaerobaculia bacterium]
RLLADGIRDEEMERARNQAETGYAHEIESIGSRADLLNTFATFHGDAEELAPFIGAYAKTSASDVLAVAERFLRQDNRSTLWVLPETA